MTICEPNCNTYQYYHYVMKNEIWKCTTSQLYATCAFTVTVYLERLEERRKEEKWEEMQLFPLFRYNGINKMEEIISAEPHIWSLSKFGGFEGRKLF